MSIGFRHLHTFASAKLPRQWFLLAAIFAVIVSVEVFFSTAIWLSLVLVLQGAVVALLLQQIADPTPLFWTIPAEVWDLVGSKRARVNHLWLHRTQALIENGIRSKSGAGYATKESSASLGEIT